MKRNNFKLVLMLILTVAFTISIAAQGNGFNFQGRLNDGTNPANGNYDLQFSLFTAITGGTQIGTTVSRPNTTLINGVFTVTLDFGATAFNNPNSVFIEIGVRPNASPNAFTILGPRQQLTVVPYAVRAMNATNADNAVNAQNSQNAVNSQNSVNSQNATLATNATNAANSNTLNGLSSTDFIRNSVSPVANQNFNIVGNGVINGNLNVAGTSVVGGNVQQNLNSSGVVKAMVYVNADSTIARCYNGITGVSTGNCGLSITTSGGGFYIVNFNFQVNDRFVSVTPQLASQVRIGTGFRFFSSTQILVETFITDVDYPQSYASNPFIIIVY